MLIVGFTSIFLLNMIVLVRWRARIAPEIEAARQAGRRAPYVEVEWPGFAKRLAKVWVFLACLGFAIGLIIALIVIISEV